jgi:type I restriction enzyme, S subunit
MATSQDFVTWTCGPRLLPGYLLWALRGTVHEILATTMGSTHQTIYMSDVEQIRIPLPPISEQRAITEYLNAEAERLDRLVSSKRHMISLLDERNARMTFDVLTGSLAGDGRRDSGLRWFGDIPSSWEAAPISSRYDVQLGRMLNEERASGDELRSYLRNVNVRWDGFRLEDVAVMSFPAAERLKYRLRPGDLLVCEGGAGIGRGAIWSGELPECYFQKSLHRVRATSAWPVEWVLEWLRICKWLNVFRVESNLATIPHLPAERLRTHRIPFPSPTVAREHLALLGRSRAKLERTRAALNAEVSLLQERRDAMITAAVRGQLDVARAAA